MVTEFKKRREGILALFETARKDLESLNAEIAAEKASNAEAIAKLQNEQKELENLSSSNKKFINILASFIRK